MRGTRWMLVGILMLGGPLSADGSRGMMGMHGMKEPMFPHLLMKARQMAPDKGDALRDLVNTKLPEFLRQKTEVQIAKIQLAMLLQDPKASERDLARAFDRLEQARMKLQKINREGILELRKILGAETFSRLFGMQGMMGMDGTPMMRGVPSPQMQEMMKRMGNMPMMPGPSAPGEKNDD